MNEYRVGIREHTSVKKYLAGLVNDAAMFSLNKEDALVFTNYAFACDMILYVDSHCIDNFEWFILYNSEIEERYEL